MIACNTFILNCTNFKRNLITLMIKKNAPLLSWLLINRINCWMFFSPPFLSLSLSRSLCCSCIRLRIISDISQSVKHSTSVMPTAESSSAEPTDETDSGAPPTTKYPDGKRWSRKVMEIICILQVRRKMSSQQSWR